MIYFKISFVSQEENEKLVESIRKMNTDTEK